MVFDIRKIKPKNSARLAGIFILTAYLMLLGEFITSKAIVLMADTISGLSVIGIAILLFPHIKNTNKLIANSYLLLKMVEGLLMLIGGIVFLSSSLAPLRSQMYDGIHFYVFIISGFCLYWLLYKTKLVPRFISIWGAVAVFSLLLTAVLDFFNLHLPALDILLLLIIINEIFLAFWLMIKGFNLPLKKKT
jgi:hypothetical protein